MLTRYDPLLPPDPAAWRETLESEQLDLVLAYHQAAGIALPNPAVHAALHVLVESQVAYGQSIPIGATITRLQNEGLDRHEAIHAVASVLVRHIQALIAGEQQTADFEPAYYAELYHLSAAGWLAEFESEDD